MGLGLLGLAFSELLLSWEQATRHDENEGVQLLQERLDLRPGGHPE